MKEFDVVAAHIAQFIRRHNINSDKVQVILRAKDDQTAAELECALANDFEPMDIVPGHYEITPRNFKRYGLTFTVATLDRSRVG
jgi:hypothetical protein